MKFPVFVRENDSSRLMKFTSVYDMQSYLEAIDIENGEYSAWDAEGRVFELKTQKPVWIKIDERNTDWESLISALRAYAATEKFEIKKEPSSAADVEEILNLIAK